MSTKEIIPIIFSYQIYNIKHNIESHHLEYLNLFCEFGRQVKLEAKKREADFPDLLFLIRDWTLGENNKIIIRRISFS